MPVMFYNDRILFTASRKVAMDAACCCGPCVACSGNQPDATVSVTVNSSCSNDCQNAAGTYTYQDFADDTNYCYWRWSKDDGSGGRYDLYIYYCKADQTWCSYIDRWFGPGDHYRYFGGDDNSCSCVSGITDVTNDLSCTGGHVTGNFSLNGDAATCSGCTASVSVG